MTKREKSIIIAGAVILLALWACLVVRFGADKGWFGGTGNIPYNPGGSSYYDDISGTDLYTSGSDTVGVLSGTDTAVSSADALPAATTTAAAPAATTTAAAPAATTTAPAATTTAAANLPDSRMVRILDYIPDAVIELKYATPENFTGEKLYNFTEAYLRYGTVKKLAAAAERLSGMGYKLVIWDAFRPYESQCRLWEKYPDPQYVSDPATGYLEHCRGNAVDITIVKEDGTAVAMPSGFDDFSAKADRDYSDVDEIKGVNSEMLELIMTECGFSGYEDEWWHYSDSVEYEIEKRFVPSK